MIQIIVEPQHHEPIWFLVYYLIVAIPIGIVYELIRCLIRRRNANKPLVFKAKFKS